MEKIKVGVIGVGHLGKLHASLYLKSPDANLIGVYDTDGEKAKNLANELGINCFSEMEELIDAVDAVNIVTPTSTHFQIAETALNKKKHIFLEKPITRTEDEARRLIELAAEKNCKIQVGHIERFNPAMLALSDIKIDPVFIEAHRLASFNPRGTDVAVVLDLMIHDLDLILHMVKSKPRKIAASGVGVISSTIDIANARIEFENGCVANVTTSRISAKKMRKMRLFQKNAYISMDFTDGFSEIFYIPEDGQEPFHNGTLAFSLGQIEQGEQKIEIKYNRLERSDVNPLLQELNSFIDAIQNNLTPVVSAQDGFAALQLANRVLKEIEIHQRRVEGVI
ncbi:MAG: Gfo/Idh/MocA family oxidoreductase [Calditrichaceae bacterium]|nr:Gfo/Idh/MocA family oxidoreductase [Calditrichaceae bacterium]MBN2709244.1 Gfo/Idh/MocA family oxidoreductase [Calditrichaceae bacterium]RQV96197.1 MAG: gfo/Idh/MocA family oxidoreductase [Calditrichota bacterium]